jgi:hypothetical protein
MSMRPFGVVDGDGYDDQVIRKQKFLAEHPEWQARFIEPENAPGYHEFRRMTGSREAVIADPHLEFVLNRVEALIRLETGTD